MAFFANVLDHPRRLFLRRAFFQVHLWAGVLLSLYIVVIALSGSLLVFEDELTATTLPAGLHAVSAGQTVGLAAVVARFHAEYPAWKLADITVPIPAMPAYKLTASDPQGMAATLAADPQTGKLYRLRSGWIEWVHDLHVYLLLPQGYGAQVNAVGAAVLLLLAFTGLALWWPGRRVWTRGLRVNLRANWRRLNFDLHNAIGFWTLALIFWWALSGVYFGFYKQVAAAVNWVAPLRNMVSPTPLPVSPAHTRVSLETLLHTAQAASPTGRLYSVSDPLLTGSSVYVSMDLRKLADFSHSDILVLDSSSGRVLSMWHYGEKHSLGDWILWSMHPLHFGTLWGLGLKVVWCVAGVGLAVLSVSGLLMYWNRFLRHRWAALPRHASGAKG